MRVAGGGIHSTVKQFTNDRTGKSTFAWVLKRWGKEVASGAGDTRKDAEDALWKAFRTMTENGEERGKEKAKARATLRYLVGARPYLMMHVAEMLIGTEMEDEAIALDAAAGEKQWWKKEDPKLRVALPTHGKALKPEVAARRAIQAIRDAKLVVEDGEVVKVNGLRRWANEVFGDSFFPLNNKRMAEEVDDE